MAKTPLTKAQKRLDTDLWIIALVTFGVFGCYAAAQNQFMDFITDRTVSVVPRLLVSALVQFGVAGLGITVVCLLRRERFSSFGLTMKNAGKAIAGTILCFLPLILEVILSGSFHGYHPFGIIVVDEVKSSGFPVSVLGMALIAVVWGFFEGFNYVVISEKINRRYPSPNRWLNWGAITCAAVCLLFHPMRFTFWGIAEMIASFAAIYGMLTVQKRTGCAWGCIFAFCFIWNAL